MFPPNVFRKTMVLLCTYFSVALGSSTVNAAAISSISFSQLDWFDDNGSLHTKDSSWGLMNMTAIPDSTDIFYINVVGRVGSTNSWMIQNLPILPSSFGEYSRQAVDFNIADFGLLSGENLSTIDVSYSVDLDPLSLAPTSRIARFW